MTRITAAVLLAAGLVLGTAGTADASHCCWRKGHSSDVGYDAPSRSFIPNVDFTPWN